MGGARRSRRPPGGVGWKQQAWVLGGSLVGLAVWYLTPVSDLILSGLLATVPVHADLELGRKAYYQSLEGRGGSISRQTYFDPYWTPRIQQIGFELVAAADDPDFASPSSSSGWADALAAVLSGGATPRPPSARDYDWDFGVVDDPSVNAFALPGGIIRVTKALLETLNLSSGELAALLGHEMGHVLHRHSQARMLEQRVLSTVLKALVYEDDDPHQESFGEAIGELLLRSAGWLGQQSFSRANEYQADATGWDLLAASHKYSPKALQKLLSKLWEHHGRKGGETSWESTHPGTLDRMKALADQWEALPSSERRSLSRRNTIT